MNKNKGDGQMMEQHKILAGLWKMVKGALEHENGVTAQKRLVEKLYKQENIEQCSS